MSAVINTAVPPHQCGGSSDEAIRGGDKLRTGHKALNTNSGNVVVQCDPVINSLKRNASCLSDSLMLDDDNNVVAGLLEIYDNGFEKSDDGDNCNSMGDEPCEYDDVYKPYGFYVPTNKGPTDFKIPKAPTDPKYQFCPPMGCSGGRGRRTEDKLRMLSGLTEPGSGASSLRGTFNGKIWANPIPLKDPP